MDFSQFIAALLYEAYIHSLSEGLIEKQSKASTALWYYSRGMTTFADFGIINP